MYQSFIRFMYQLLLASEPRPLYLFCVVVTMEAYRLIIGIGRAWPYLTFGLLVSVCIAKDGVERM
jgi:hypothetical protein